MTKKTLNSSTSIDGGILLQQIAKNNTYNLSEYMPFFIENTHLGFIAKEFLPILEEKSPFFKVIDAEIHLSSDLNDFSSRSAFFDDLLHDLRAQNQIEPFRDEFYAIAQNLSQDPFLKIRRGASAYFGFRNYGVHLNGYVHKEGRLYMWIGIRSSSKQIAPGKLDHIVGGGMPMGLSAFENLKKEAQEEASIPEQLLINAKDVKKIHYCRQTGPKLRRDTIFVYDVELPADFVPVNSDGEVDAFRLMPIEEVIHYLHEPDAFKFNCNLVIIDFLIRHRQIHKDTPYFEKLEQSLTQINHDQSI